MDSLHSKDYEAEGNQCKAVAKMKKSLSQVVNVPATGIEYRGIKEV
ncbi:MAG: hypothetical protein IPH84_02815 [Bacteroidales bacterium]|nr:hypothetical protein [Bacteroidales bacterium]